ncbi:hypothetical protein ABK040_004506 [Willaertia magna]
MPSALFSDLLVEIGRAATYTVGPNKGKLVVIVDILDANRVLIEGPTAGIARQIAGMGNLKLLKGVAKVTKDSTSEQVKSAIAEAGLEEVAKSSPVVAKIVKEQKRKSLTDFDRFKVQHLKKQKNQILREKVQQLLKSK